MKKKISIIKEFFAEKIWCEDFKTKNIFLRALIYLCRIIIITLKNFHSDKCLLRASSLVYTTLLSLVPVLALSFSLLKAFGFQNRLNFFLSTFLSPIGDRGSEITEYIITYVDNTNFASLGFFGLAGIIIAVVLVMSNIEKTFNDVWNIKKSRHLFRKFSDYFSVLLVGPLFIIISIGIIASLESNWLINRYFADTIFSTLFFSLLKSMPFILLTLTFTFIYLFLPNKRVKFYSGLIAGVITSFLFIQSQLYYNYFAIISVKYNAIYGAIAQIPLFLVWIYICWIIILLGAEISYSVQYYKTYIGKYSSSDISQKEFEIIAFSIYFLLIKYFKENKTLKLQDIIEILKIPEKIIKQVILVLSRLNFIIISEQDETILVLRNNPETLTISNFFDTIKTYKENKDETLITENQMKSFNEYILKNFNNKFINLDAKYLNTIIPSV
jgi:membrane protein